MEGLGSVIKQHARHGQAAPDDPTEILISSESDQGDEPDPAVRFDDFQAPIAQVVMGEQEPQRLERLVFRFSV